MSDALDRCRWLQEHDDAGSNDWKAAANEIERLRKENKRLRKIIDHPLADQPKE